jgi:maleylpyruvate isomerase
VTVDPLGLSAEVDRANERLFKTVESLDDAAISVPCLLPGWTRGHLLTHLARNADSYVNLLTWARTGVETPQYPDLSRRDPEIEAGAARPSAAHLADLRASAERFAAAAAAMTPAAWSATIRYGSGIEAKAAHVVWARLREVEVHHVDVGAAYSPDDWSDAFTLRLLHEVAGTFAEASPALRVSADDLDFRAEMGAAGAGAAVHGSARALAAWLIGRSAGTGLTTEPDGPLPPVPTWK